MHMLLSASSACTCTRRVHFCTMPVHAVPWGAEPAPRPAPRRRQQANGEPPAACCCAAAAAASPPRRPSPAAGARRHRASAAAAAPVRVHTVPVNSVCMSGMFAARCTCAVHTHQLVGRLLCVHRQQERLHLGHPPSRRVRRPLAPRGAGARGARARIMVVPAFRCGCPLLESCEWWWRCLRTGRGDVHAVSSYSSAAARRVMVKTHAASSMCMRRAAAARSSEREQNVQNTLHQSAHGHFMSLHVKTVKFTAAAPARRPPV